MKSLDGFTRWMPYGQFGVKCYRIAQKQENGTIVSRHEYMMIDGTIEYSDWCSSMADVSESFECN